MSEFPDDIMATASWVAAHRLDLSKEAGQQIVRLIAHSLNDERTKAGTRIAALDAENERLRKALEKVAAEAKTANDVIRMNRDGGGNGRVKVATAMHRIEHGARAALEAKP